MKKGLKIFLVISAILFVIMGLGLLAVSPYLSAVMQYRRNAVAIARSSSASDFRSTETSIIYDVNGEEITTISGAVELYYLESARIPDIVKKAFMLVEDRKFYNHGGVDMAAIVRAVLINLKSGSKAQGASTITQQLARNIYLTQDVTWERKITEMFLAVELEKRYSKEQILEFYINNIYFANGYYGIEAAAEGYFDTSVDELTLSELIFLVAIPKNPYKYNPADNMERTVDRRDYILGLLHEYGYITDEDYNNALSEEIVLSWGEHKKVDSVETFVYYCATRSLMEAGGFVFRDEFISEEDEAAYNELYDDYYSRYQMSLFTGGYRIYTSIDMEKQELLMGIVNDTLAGHTDTNEEGVYKLQASAVCIDNSTGYVTAIVGGRDQGLPGYTFNRAYQSFRQPGSTIKPLVVYAPYLGLGHNPDEIIDDSKMEDGPVNFDERYPGESTLQEALAWSSNVAAWKLFQEMTPEYGMSFVKKMHFKKAAVDEHYMAACLGGWTYGTSALEMASGYAALANYGLYREPTAVMRITDSEGRLIVDNSFRGTAVYDGNAACMVSKMLEYGVENGIATGAQLDNAVVAVKTGTTTGNKDGWTIGYSMYYTTAVWVGCDLPERVENLTGGTYPMTIWKEYMGSIHEGLDIMEFPDYMPYEEKDDMPDYNEQDDSSEETASPENGNSNPGDSDYSGHGGDSDADINIGGDSNASGGVGGDEKAAGGFGGDTNASGTNDGDVTAPGGTLGDVTAPGGSGGDRNAPQGTGGDKSAPQGSGGDMSAPQGSGGDQNAPSGTGGDATAPGGTGGDQNAPAGSGGDAI